LIIEREVGTVKAVDGISFDIQKGETLGLVGESGCGKTTAGRTILGLYPLTSGTVRISDIQLPDADKEELRLLRRKAQMIFQIPMPR
jgi:oligopeptide transport system ATP-binding protein